MPELAELLRVVDGRGDEYDVVSYFMYFGLRSRADGTFCIASAETLGELKDNEPAIREALARRKS